MLLASTLVFESFGFSYWNFWNIYIYTGNFRLHAIKCFYIYWRRHVHTAWFHKMFLAHYGLFPFHEEKNYCSNNYIKGILTRFVFILNFLNILNYLNIMTMTSNNYYKTIQDCKQVQTFFLNCSLVKSSCTIFWARWKLIH